MHHSELDTQYSFATHKHMIDLYLKIEEEFHVISDVITWDWALSFQGMHVQADCSVAPTPDSVFDVSKSLYLAWKAYSYK